MRREAGNVLFRKSLLVGAVKSLGNTLRLDFNL